MSSLFPPILESQRASIPSQTSPVDFIIPVTLPLSIDIHDIIGGGPSSKPGGHIQVLIRRQIDMSPWCDTGSSNVPERDVIYLPGTALSSDGLNITVPSFTIKSFIAGDSPGSPLELQTGRTYTIQVRFGNRSLWTEIGETFATWKAAEIANSRFGEWSNTQRMFVYGVPSTGDILNVSVVDDIIGRINWQYTPISQDPITQVRITYRWTVPDGGTITRSKNVDFSNSDGLSSGSFGTIDLEAMRFVKISVGLRFTTVNNTIFDWVEDIEAYSFAVDHSSGNNIRQYPVVGEEIEDGVIAMTFAGTFRRNAAVDGIEELQYKIYRVDTTTLDTIFLKEIDGPVGTAFAETVRDYGVEMGAEYVYIAASYGLTTSRVHYVLAPVDYLQPAVWNPSRYSGYGRQMNFQGNVFLTTKFQQLRLQGNVTVGNFQRNTSDQITTTIGGQFPFYSRSAAYNYRTMSIQGLISINFDSTHTFLNFKPEENQDIADAKARIAKDYQAAISALNSSSRDYEQKMQEIQSQYYKRLAMIYCGINPPPVPVGAPTALSTNWMNQHLWFVESEDNKKVLLRSSDLFSTENYSLSRKRVSDVFNTKNQQIRSVDDVRGLRGPTTVYDSLLRQDTTQVQHSDRKNELIYAERKFREAVMEWLSDGKPKLLRSETEGNMIVMLTGVSFTPFNKSREVYSLSATVTEIAEYNLSNLILYGLIPVEFEPAFIPEISFDFIPGPIDSEISGGIPVYPAPDGRIYALQNMIWVDITDLLTMGTEVGDLGGITNPPHNDVLYGLQNAKWVDITKALTMQNSITNVDDTDKPVGLNRVYGFRNSRWVDITESVMIKPE